MVWDQWSLDFVDPLSLIIWHRQYVLVMNGHFSKWPKSMPLPNHNNEIVAYAFLDRVFNRFGVLAKVLTTQGTHVNWIDGANNEMKFAKVWVSKGSY